MGLDNVLFRPARLQYVRGQKQVDCVFCAALNATDSGSLIVCTTDHAFVILNKYPYNNGHLLVLPRRHVADLTELTDLERNHTQALLKFAIEAHRETSSVQGFNVGLNLGAAAGAGLPSHLHWHLIPRWSGDLNFLPLIARTKVVVETLEQTKLRLQARLQAKVNAWLQTETVAE